MEKRKILFITPSLCQGGIEHSQITMLKLLDKEKYDITLFLYLNDVTLLPLVPKHVRVIIDKDTNHYHRRIKAVWFHLLETMGSVFNMHELQKNYAEALRQFIHSERAKHPARDVFKNEEFDVVISNAIGICTEMAQYISAKKRYVFFHSSVDLHHEMLEKVFPKYNGIVAVSEGVKDMLQKAYPHVRDKVLVLENYVNAEEILEKAEKCSIEGGVDKTKQYTLVSCGRLSSEKGFDMAAEAAALFARKYNDFIWYFIGDGPERGKVEKVISKYSLENNICITGYKDNPFGMMKQCDVYVQPSYEESYGRTIKEALILGCPVVSTATVGGNTLIRDKENGILTDINAEALAKGIIEMIESPELQKKCRECYTIKQNECEKMTYKNGLEELLS